MKASRNELLIYINAQRVSVSGAEAFWPFSQFLRSHLSQTGTKVVCAEGDCGACSILVADPTRKKSPGQAEFRAVNSCILPTYLLDGTSVVTVEGLKSSSGTLSEVQKKMVECHGSQCGFCTPGFVVALAGMFEKTKEISSQDVKNFTTGNLCRCTGYQPIIDSAMAVDPKKCEPLVQRYLTPAIRKELVRVSETAFEIRGPEKIVYGPTKVRDVSKLLKSVKNLRIVSSATDLGVQYNKEKIELDQVLTLHHVQDLFRLEKTKKHVYVGAKVDLATLQGYLKDLIPDFSHFLRIFASPQIRHVATLVGNVANASPIADTLPFLFVMEAVLELQSEKGQRLVPIRSFYKGYKKTDLRKGEWISGVLIPCLKKDQRLFLYKVSQRRDLDISTVNAGFLLEKKKEKIESIRIAFGGVGPTVLRLPATEEFLKEHFQAENLDQSMALLQKEIAPLSDLRGSEAFRRKVSRNLLKKFYLEASGADSEKEVL